MSYNIAMKKYYYTNEVSEKMRSVKALPDWLLDIPVFSKQINMIMETLGLTQAQLAKKIDSTERSISRIEKGTMIPNVALLQKIAEVLNTELKIILVPKKNINDLLNEKAFKKAKELVNSAKNNSVLELQGPSVRSVNTEIEKLQKELLEKKRNILWEK